MTNSILPPPIFLTYSLGCRTNQAEMESIGLQLTDYGLQQVGNGLLTTDYRLQQPDIILVNTCVVTQKAEKETRQKIRELRKKYPKSFLVVLGCAVSAKEKFKIILPETDLYISNENKNLTVRILADQLFKKSNHYKLILDRERFCNNVPINKYQLSGRKFIKIQDGCNCGCSFCLTQFIRGKPTSIPPERIIEETNFWVKNGIKEIILTGINIGLYSVIARGLPPKQSQNQTRLLRRSAPRNDIVFLVKKILSDTKIERISFSSIYPEMLTDDFLKVVVNNLRISQYFHLSLQSGSPTVLERMSRKTDLSRLLFITKQIKKQNPLFTFRTDIITGFPDETEEEFQETLDFIKQNKISFVHSFLFSRRQHTKSEGFLKSGKWKEVALPIKKRRVEILNITAKKIRKEEARKMIGLSTQCLIIKNSVIARGLSPKQSRDRHEAEPLAMTKNKIAELVPSTARDLFPAPRNDRGFFEGITENGWNIKIKNQSASWRTKIKNIKGKILTVKITGFEKDYLAGEITSFPTN